MTFGERLAKARKDKGLSQAALGHGLGTDGADAGKSVIYGWEKDQHFPRVDQLVLICQKLDCSADYLLWGLSAEWPFSEDLHRLVSALDPEGLAKLENVMRAHLGQPAPAAEPDRSYRQPLVVPKKRPIRKNA